MSNERKADKSKKPRSNAEFLFGRIARSSAAADKLLTSPHNSQALTRRSHHTSSYYPPPREDNKYSSPDHALPTCSTSYISDLRPGRLTQSQSSPDQADDITRLQERIRDIEAYSLCRTGYDESRSPHLPNFYTTVDTLANLMKVAVNDALYYDSLRIPNQERTTQLSQTDLNVFCLAANECSQQGFEAEAEWNIIAHTYRAFTNFRSPSMEQMTEDNLEKFMDISATQGDRLSRPKGLGTRRSQA